MAQYILRPDGDVKADWTEDPVGTAFSVLDDNVTQPTAPTTGSDRITSATNGQGCNVTVGTTTLAGGETPVSATAWVYIITPATRSCAIKVNLDPEGDIATTTVPAGTAASWQSATYTGSLTQTQVNSLRISITNGTGSGTTEIDAAYIELNTQIGSGSMMLRGMG